MKSNSMNHRKAWLMAQVIGLGLAITALCVMVVAVLAFGNSDSISSYTRSQFMIANVILFFVGTLICVISMIALSRTE